MTSDVDIVLNPDVVFTRLDERSAALLHLVTKRYYTLSGTGPRIWELLAQGRTSDAVLRALAEEYEVDPAAAAVTLERFVEELRDEGLLTVALRPAARNRS